MEGAKRPDWEMYLSILPLNTCFVPQNQAASTPGSSLLRCDKLDQAEIKSLLMCFLHVLKSMSEGNATLRLPPEYSQCPCLGALNAVLTYMPTMSICPFPDALFTYWNKASSAELMDFFTLVE